MTLPNMPVGSPGLTSLAQLYGFAGNIASFAVSHIDTLKAADNALANRCGLVLEAANSGFGVGHETAMILIGVGQGMLGNPLTGTVASGAITNPIVMTCAAVGAIHYGWKAMSDSERDALLKTVGSAFQIGVEFIRSIASFAFDFIQTLMSRENLAELKRLVVEAAASFGRRLGDVTHLLSDRLIDGASYVRVTAGNAASAAWAHVPNVPSIAKLTRSSADGNKGQD